MEMYKCLQENQKLRKEMAKLKEENKKLKERNLISEKIQTLMGRQNFLMCDSSNSDTLTRKTNKSNASKNRDLPPILEEDIVPDSPHTHDSSKVLATQRPKRKTAPRSYKKPDLKSKLRRQI